MFSSEFVVFPLLGIAIFTIAYLNADRLIQWLSEKSLGSREEIINKLDLMFVKIERKKITWALLLTSFGFGALFFFLFWPNLWFSIPVFCVITVLGWTIPKHIVNGLYEKRCDAFTNQMVDAMTIMANGIRSGLSITQSMERVVANMSAPISQEFRLVLSEVQLGRTVEEALSDLGERIPRADVQMFVTSVNILKETGGNMAETFQTIQYTVRERQKIEKKIEALTAQGVTQAVIITLVPFLLLIVFYVVDPNFVLPLFTKPLGWLALMIMLGLQVTGGLLMRKIIKIQV